MDGTKQEDTTMMQAEAEQESPTTALARIVQPLEVGRAATIRENFEQAITLGEDWAESGRRVLALPEDDPRRAVRARALRLEIRPIRAGVENKAKELRKAAKARVEDEINAIGAVEKLVLALAGPVEKAMQAAEDLPEQRRQDATAKLARERAGQLRDLGVSDAAMPAALGDASDETWAEILQSARDAKAKREEDARMAEQVRIETEQRIAREREEKRLEAARQQEANRRANVGQHRYEMVTALLNRQPDAGPPMLSAADLGDMTNEEWAATKCSAEAERDAREATLREEKRLADEAAVRERRESDCLQAEAATKLAAERQAHEAEREASEKAARVRKKQAAEKVAELEAAASRERGAAMKERRLAEEAAERERLARDLAEAEAARLRQAEADRVAQVERDKAAAADAEAERVEREATAPDRQKLRAYGLALAGVHMPRLGSTRGRTLAVKITDRLAKLCQDIEASAEKLT